MAEIRYDNQVVVVTGGGNGLGKQYSKFFASRGAKVVVNDLGGTFNGKPGADAAVADVVVQEIKDAGGEAVANYNACQEGDKIIKTAIDNYGRVDVLINNAGNEPMSKTTTHLRHSLTLVPFCLQASFGTSPFATVSTPPARTSVDSAMADISTLSSSEGRRLGCNHGRPRYRRHAHSPCSLAILPQAAIWQGHQHIFC